MRLTPGLRLESATCATQVVVVRAPKADRDVDLRCGGAPVRELGSPDDRLPATESGDGTLVGKRYVHDPTGLEILCTRGGTGTLSVDGAALGLKEAKPLPSSD